MEKYGRVLFTLDGNYSSFPEVHLSPNTQEDVECKETVTLNIETGMGAGVSKFFYVPSDSQTRSQMEFDH